MGRKDCLLPFFNIGNFLVFCATWNLLFKSRHLCTSLFFWWILYKSTPVSLRIWRYNFVQIIFSMSVEVLQIGTWKLYRLLFNQMDTSKANETFVHSCRFIGILTNKTLRVNFRSWLFLGFSRIYVSWLDSWILGSSDFVSVQKILQIFVNLCS